MKSQLFAVVLLLVVAGMSLAGTNPILPNPAGAKQVNFNSNGVRVGGEYVRVNNNAGVCENVTEMSANVAPVSLNVSGESFSVGGINVRVPMQVVDDLKNVAQWDDGNKVVKIRRKEWELREKWWHPNYDSNYKNKLADVLRHEVIHALVSQKYTERFPDGGDSFYHFVSEMLAYKGGDGMSELEAAKFICDNKKVYGEEVCKHASEFIDVSTARVKKEFLKDKCAGSLQDNHMSVANKIPDLSKLIDAMRRIAECLRRINVMSSKPSEEDYAEYNKLMDKFAEEAEKVEKVLEDEIGKMKTEDEQVKFSKQLGDLFDRQYGGSKLCNEILSLQKQIQAKGYGRFTPRNLNLNVNFLK